MKKATTRITHNLHHVSLKLIKPWRSEKLEKCIGFNLSLYLSKEQ